MKKVYNHGALCQTALHALAMLSLTGSSRKESAHEHNKLVCPSRPR